MAVAVAITKVDCAAADLRRLMSKERDGELVRRLSALALVLEDHSRTEATGQSDIYRKTLRDWVDRYNEGGVAALASSKSTGRRPKIDAAQMAQLYDLVVKGPDPEIDGVVRWRCVDLRAQIARRFSVDVPEAHDCQIAATVAINTAATTALSSQAEPGCAGRI